MTNILPAVSLYGPDLIGILLPPVIDILNKDIPENQELKRFVATIAVCFLTAVLMKVNTITLANSQDLISSAAVIFLESQLVYKTYFKNSFLRSKLLDKLSTINNPDMSG